MIIRVFRARVAADRAEDFETKYVTVSVPFMLSCAGITEVEIGRPLDGSNEDYVMVSKWQSREHLENALGAGWREPHIPSGMEDLILDCYVAHFEQMAVLPA